MVTLLASQSHRQFGSIKYCLVGLRPGQHSSTVVNNDKRSLYKRCQPTFSNLCPIKWLTGDHFLDKSFAIGQPTRPTQPSILPGSVNMSRMNFSGYVERVTIACCLVVGLGLVLGLHLVSGWLVVMHTYLYYFRMSLSHCRIPQGGGREHNPGPDDRTESILLRPTNSDVITPFFLFLL